MEESLKVFARKLELTEHDIRAYSGLQFAYIGDAVYEVIVRSFVMDRANGPVEKMHRHATSMVRASAQAAIIRQLEAESALEPEELVIFHRGRNARSYSKAKNASMADYRAATGFEALCGWLWLTGQMERLACLTRRGFEILGEVPAE